MSEEIIEDREVGIEEVEEHEINHKTLVEQFGATSSLKEIPGVGLNLFNCYAFVKQQYYPSLPPTAVLKANLTKEYSDVAVFYYKKSGLPHYAKTIAIRNNGTFLVDEANYRTGKRTLREVAFDDPNLLGFYKMVD